MSPDERFVGKDIPASEFGGDEGDVDPAVLAALCSFADQSIPRGELLEVLADSRVFVPVTAILDSADIDEHGHKVEKDSHMATVSMQTADGRRGLLAFTSIVAFNAWDADSRPVPARMRQAAAAAIDEGADALVIDVANAHRTALTARELDALVDGKPLQSASSDPAIAQVILAAIADIGHRYECQFELTPPQGAAAIRLNLLAKPGLEPGQILQEVADALQADDYLRSALAEGVELGVAAAE
jgi:hypothetical protein